jgi:hypothetical protein
MPSRTVLSRAFVCLVGVVALFPLATNLLASKEPCNQSLIDQLPPTTTYYIYPRVLTQPFYQWENNFGYCGEVSMMAAGLANGEWMSQYDARLVCGAGLGQSGAPVTTNAWCSKYGVANYNAEALLEEPNTGVSGNIEAWGVMSQCAANMRLNSIFYPYQGVAAQQPANLCTGKSASSACPGYQSYLSWIKQQVIQGYTVTIGVLIQNVATAGDQYDHIVPVVKIGTNHSPTDPTYYPDDVLYFEDHGVYWYNGSRATDDTAPEPPPGSGNNTTQCTPYIFGYTFAEMGATGSQASKSKNKYSIVLPANTSIQTWTGFDGNTKKTGGRSSGPIIGPNDFAVAVSGPMDTYGETVPVVLTASPQPGSIVGPTYTSGVQNPQDPLAGYDYEYPYIGNTDEETGCTNTPPSSWMTNFVLQATVSGLAPGVTYNLYEYQFGSPTSTDTMGTGPAAALAVPVTAFNANSAAGASTPAHQVTTFTASGSSYVAPALTTTSDQIVVYRAVPSAPGLYSPANGSTLSGTSVTFAWDSSTVGPAVGATAYYLTVGSTQGGSQYYNSGDLSSTTFSATVSDLPSNGSTVWARWSYLVGGQWGYNDYTYNAQ